MIRRIPILLALVTAILTFQSCGSRSSRSEEGRDSITIPFPDTLKVVTLYSPSSYFIYKEQEMGYDYDLIQRLASDKGVSLQLEVAPSLTRAVEMLDSGKVDVIAYEVPVTAEYREKVLPAGPENITHQVLVQPKSGGGNELITDVTQLIGKEVYVEEGTKYHARLNNLNTELGGGIIIKPIDRDTLITEDLIAMVSKGEIPLTVVDSDIARLNRTYYRDLDITLQISFPQRSSWGVAPDRQWLADSIDSWFVQESPRHAQAELLKRYFERSKNQSQPYTVDFRHGRISPFDHLFKQMGQKIGWDWRLLASMGYTESKFDSTVVSWAGARGVMQLMPRTARAHGLDGAEITVNSKNIATAAEVIRSLDNSLKPRVPDNQERRKFVIAAYNSGLAHILDAIALADKYGLDDQRWDGQVEQALLMKSKPEYFNDPVCKYGYFRGRQTSEYVRNVMEFYSQTEAKIHK